MAPSSDFDLGSSGSDPLAPDAAAASTVPELAMGERRSSSGGMVPLTTAATTDLDLFENDDLDEPNHLLDDTSADAYFAELLSHSLDRLSQEPQMLEAEARRAEARGLEAAVRVRKAAQHSR